MRSRQSIIILILSALFALTSQQCIAQIFIQNDARKSDIVDQLQNAQIDWSNEFYYASGEGILPKATEEPDRTKAYNKAKGYAKMKAITNLLMAVEGTAVSYKAVGRDYLSKDMQLRQTIEGYAGNAEIVGEKQQAEGMETVVVVTIRVPMYDSRGVGTAVLKARFMRDSSPDNPPTGLAIEKRSDTKATISSDSKGPFTSLIIDCSGLRIDRSLSPNIRRIDGSEVLGSALKLEYLQNHGIVAYARSVEDAKRKNRAGANPLVVKAVGRSGGRFMCDPIISDTDAERILQENQSSRFLDKFDVIFAIDAN